MPCTPALSLSLARHPLSAACCCAVLLLVVGAAGRAADIEEGFEDGRPRWSLADANCSPRVSGHAIQRDAAHRGDAGERFVLDAAAGSTLRLQFPIGAASVIDEFRAAVWVRANRPAMRLGVRIALPNFTSRHTGQPIHVVVQGTASRQPDRWELLEVADVVTGLERQLSALLAQHGSHGSLAGAVVTDLVLELYSSPGHYDLAIDDLRVEGLISVTAARGQSAGLAGSADGGGASAVRQAAFTEAASPVAPVAAPTPALTRGVLEVGGVPFFPRSLDYNGEPLEAIARLGFNCVRLSAPATADLLAEAEQAGVWLVSPPPDLPDALAAELGQCTAQLHALRAAPGTALPLRAGAVARHARMHAQPSSIACLCGSAGPRMLTRMHARECTQAHTQYYALIHAPTQFTSLIVESIN
jgi:hypothetical protein